MSAVLNALLIGPSGNRDRGVQIGDEARLLPGSNMGIYLLYLFRSPLPDEAATVIIRYRKLPSMSYHG
jgi:hypothetical protein